MTDRPATAIEAADTYSIAHLKLVRRVFYGRWVAAIAIVVAFAFLINAFAHGQIAFGPVRLVFVAGILIAFGIVGVMKRLIFSDG